MSDAMAVCIYLVGSDTGVGKTAVACALLRAARVSSQRIVPFKPAQSSDAASLTDAERLLDASGLPRHLAARMAPFSVSIPIAPGLAEDPSPFFRPHAANTSPHSPALARVRSHLDAWIRERTADIVLIEGAGGLHVPMPGGTWQPTWIRTLADHTVVVARAGLGTINHTLLTIDALRALGRPPLGFYLSHVDPMGDPSTADNATVIAVARNLPLLGTLHHTVTHDGMASTDLLSPLLDALA